MVMSPIRGRSALPPSKRLAPKSKKLTTDGDRYHTFLNNFMQLEDEKRPSYLVQAVLPHMRNAYEEGLKTLLAVVSGEVSANPEERRNAGALLLESMYQDINLVNRLKEMPRIQEIIMSFANIPCSDNPDDFTYDFSPLTIEEIAIQILLLLHPTFSDFVNFVIRSRDIAHTNGQMAAPKPGARACLDVIASKIDDWSQAQLESVPDAESQSVLREPMTRQACDQVCMAISACWQWRGKENCTVEQDISMVKAAMKCIYSFVQESADAIAALLEGPLAQMPCEVLVEFAPKAFGDHGHQHRSVVAQSCKVMSQMFVKASTREVSHFYSSCSEHLFNLVKHPSLKSELDNNDTQMIDLVSQVTWFFATSSGLGGLLQLMEYCCKNHTDSTRVIEEGCKTINAMEDSWWPMTLPDSQPNSAYLIPFVNLLRDILTHHPCAGNARLKKYGVKALGGVASLTESPTDLSFSAAEMIWSCIAPMADEPQSDVLKFIMISLYELCAAKPQVAEAVSKSPDLQPMILKVLTNNRSYHPVARPCFQLIGSLYGWEKIVAYMNEHLDEAVVVQAALQSLQSFYESEPRPQVPAQLLYDRYSHNEYVMFDLLTVLYAAEPDDDSDPLQHPYNQEVLRVIRQTFTADNSCIEWHNNSYTVGTSWVCNRLKCCRAIADFATVIATSSHKDKLAGLLDEFREDVVATVDYFWLEANQMTYENTEMALLAITLVKGPMAMMPYMDEAWQVNISASVVVSVLRLGLYHDQMLSFTKKVYTPEALARAATARDHFAVIDGLLGVASAPPMAQAGC